MQAFGSTTVPGQWTLPVVMTPGIHKALEEGQGNDQLGRWRVLQIFHEFEK